VLGFSFPDLLVDCPVPSKELFIYLSLPLLHFLLGILPTYLLVSILFLYPVGSYRLKLKIIFTYHLHLFWFLHFLFFSFLSDHSFTPASFWYLFVVTMTTVFEAPGAAKNKNANVKISFYCDSIKVCSGRKSIVLMLAVREYFLFS